MMNSIPLRGLHRLLICAWLAGLVPAAAGASARFTPAELRCEYLKDPAAVQTPAPRLSWVLQAQPKAPRDQYQSVWQILVATDPARLAPGKADLWDSGKQLSRQTTQIEYRGQALASGQKCYWKVRCWDQDGRVSPWSHVAHWTVGFLHPADWHAQWIGRDETLAPTQFTNIHWIWFPEGRAEESAPPESRYFRKRFAAPENPIRRARLLVAADDQSKIFFNGQPLGTTASFTTLTPFDLDKKLRPGQNLLAISVKNAGPNPTPAGLLCTLEILLENGEQLKISTDDSWLASAAEFPNWEQPQYEDSTWLPARLIGPAGIKPWGPVTLPTPRDLPARHLRKEFTIEKPVRRATVRYSGLGLSELYLNGRRVGDEALSPGLTEYDKEVFYLTHDVTPHLRPGPNALAAWLGNGRYFAPRDRVPTETRTYGFPKLLLQLDLEHTDGTTARIVSDPAWMLTTNGPIRANNEYDGELYDARLEMPGWDQPGFDASAWEPAAPVAPPGGVLRAQPIEPIRKIETLRPVSRREISPGVYIYDLGQNLVGWCRLRLQGPPGTQVQLRHAETLQPDGTLYVDNLRSALARDVYTLKGGGPESYEPRFTYHGFRYVELTGHPGPPSPSTLEACVVHDDLTPTGQFTCSNPLLNRIYTNILWGVRGNYRSIPTDCPQRDERQGWLGDRSAESQGEMYLFDTAAFYAKWLRDIAAAQKPDGSVPDVAPSYWPIYNDNVTWPSSTVLIPGHLYHHYADTQLLSRHYPSAKLWIHHMLRYLTNGIITRDNYGDWCVPPESPLLIHSADPARKTAGPLLATAYLAYDARLMSLYAGRLGLNADAASFASLSQELRDAFNARFLNRELALYDNGTQTSCIIPLAFDLVPPEYRDRLFSHLVRSIEHDTAGHIGTGLIGAQWLMRTLTRGGRPDLAWRIATQSDYPSWGYMVHHDATTIWELWNGNTADPAMNSGNHVMLVGDLVIWCYESLAAIRPEPGYPGFQRLRMRPEIIPGLHWVRAAYDSPAGPIRSAWTRHQNQFTWEISIPVNATAILELPTFGPAEYAESGLPLARSKSITILGATPGRQLVEIGSGSYTFQIR